MNEWMSDPQGTTTELNVQIAKIHMRIWYKTEYYTFVVRSWWALYCCCCCYSWSNHTVQQNKSFTFHDKLQLQSFDVFTLYQSLNFTWHFFVTTINNTVVVFGVVKRVKWVTKKKLIQKFYKQIHPRNKFAAYGYLLSRVRCRRSEYRRLDQSFSPVVFRFEQRYNSV